MKNKILKLSIKHGFDDAFIVPIIKNTNIPCWEVKYDINSTMPSANSILLLLKRHYPYNNFPKESMSIHSHYPAYHKAYHMHKSLILKLNQIGYNAKSANTLPLKAYAISAGLKRLKNSLIYHKDFGSYFVIQAIALNVEANDEILLDKNNICGDCTKCIKSCPTNAIGNDGIVDINKCIRRHVPVSNFIDNKLRNLAKTNYIGCGICQSVCPLNNHIKAVPPSQNIVDALNLENMLNTESNKLQIKALAEIIGKNGARTNRAIATACLSAGNTKNKKYIPYLKIILTTSSFPTARGYAAWALGMIGENQSYLSDVLSNELDLSVNKEIINAISIQ